MIIPSTSIYLMRRRYARSLWRLVWSVSPPNTSGAISSCWQDGSAYEYSLQISPHPAHRGLWWAKGGIGPRHAAVASARGQAAHCRREDGRLEYRGQLYH